MAFRWSKFVRNFAGRVRAKHYFFYFRNSLGDYWPTTSRHVGTKGIALCILFLELYVGDLWSRFRVILSTFDEGESKISGRDFFPSAEFCSSVLGFTHASA